MKKVLIRSIPLLLALMLILGLTVQNTSDNVELSERCRKYTVKVLNHFDIETNNVWWNTPANYRKVGHVIEFMCLGMGIYFAFRMPIFGIIVCITISILDQYIKMHIPIRHFDVTDIPFDLIGGIIGISIMMIAVGRRKR